SDTAPFAFGGSVTDQPVVGDWNGDGRTKVGFYRQGVWFLDSNGDHRFDGSDTAPFAFGRYATDRALVGNRQPGQTRALAGVPHPTGPVESLSEAALAPVVAAAIQRWQTAEISTQHAAMLQQVQFVVTDLPAGILAEALPGLVLVDRRAAGQGW